MRQDEIWNAEAAQRYDTPGTGMFAPEVLGPTVDRLAELAAGGRALEFAVGTGRVAIPLAERGVPVTGIELSRPMIERLREKVDEAMIPVVLGDMATATAPGRYSLTYLVFNTISNLLTQAEQVACFRNAARHLEPGGAFVIELEVPPLRMLPPGQQAVVFATEPGYIGLDTIDVLSQHLVSYHFPVRRQRPGQAVQLRAQVRLAGRAGPDGPAGRVRAGNKTRGLAWRRVHGRVPVTRLRVPATRAALAAERRHAEQRVVGVPARHRPTAVFCANNLLALGFLQQMTLHDEAVPDEMAIVG